MAAERDQALIERLVEREVLHSGTYLDFVRDTIADVDGGRHTREVALHPGAVTVVAVLPDMRVLLVRQYRHAASQVLLELPAGTLDRMPDGSIEDPLVAAQRELFEETGHRASDWRLLASFYTAPGFATELMHLYLATGVKADPSHTGPEPDERLELEMLPFDDVYGQAVRGELNDAKTIIGLFAVHALALAGEVDELRAT